MTKRPGVTTKKSYTIFSILHMSSYPTKKSLSPLPNSSTDTPLTNSRYTCKSRLYNNNTYSEVILTLKFRRKSAMSLVYMLSKRPSVAVTIKSPASSLKEEVMAEDGLQNKQRNTLKTRILIFFFIVL